MKTSIGRKKLKAGEKLHQNLAEVLRQAAIPRFEELARYLYPQGHKEGCRWCVGNVHGDPGRTFSINLRTTVFGDFADSAKMQSGAINLWMAARGVDFATACRELKDWVGLSWQESTPRYSPPPPPPLQPVAPDPLRPMDLLRMYRANLVLCRAPELVFDVLGERPEWTHEAIRTTALGGDLGFEHNCQWYDIDGPAVLFGYSHGIKARWMANGERVVKWICGGPAGQCWRQSLLCRYHQRVYITEGETDTLTGISIGLEDDPVPSLVIGLASASQTPKVEGFRGKEVIILADPDRAGADSARKLLKLYAGVARKTIVIELEEEVQS
jgi:hypothetical protein